MTDTLKLTQVTGKVVNKGIVMPLLDLYLVWFTILSKLPHKLNFTTGVPLVN